MKLPFHRRHRYRHRQDACGLRALLHAVPPERRCAVGMKPVAAGIERENGENEDVTLPREARALRPSRADQSLLLREPIAPHIAAADEGVTVGPAAHPRA